MCKCCVHQCGWCSQPEFDAWANSGQPDSSTTGTLALNCGCLHMCTCSFLYEHQYGVIKSAFIIVMYLTHTKYIAILNIARKLTTVTIMNCNFYWETLPWTSWNNHLLLLNTNCAWASLRCEVPWWIHVSIYNLADNTRCKTQYLLLITYLKDFFNLSFDELSSHTTVALAQP